MSFDLTQSRALWNRTSADLESNELLAQILDRGELEAWREIYRRASGPSEEAAALRQRIIHLCRTVPLAFPHLFLAAMGALGEELNPYPEVPAPMDDLA
jgi:DNA-binding helix-hairpin-helix protein with protein kinase domain